MILFPVANITRAITIRINAAVWRAVICKLKPRLGLSP